MPHMTLYIPFGDDEAEVMGRFTPSTPGCNYLRNGDPGYPPEPADFCIDHFNVNGVDIIEDLMQMYIKVDNKKYKWYIDHITPLLIEKAEQDIRDGIDIPDEDSDNDWKIR